ncbi:MAG: hypothetical protein FWB80_01530 [Defluviitaleaceae bacterium]|nr:hypothetical protein [Defluviitaleaceae bacterium]
MESKTRIDLVDFYRVYVDHEVEEHMIEFMKAIQDVIDCEYRRGYDTAKQELTA